MPISPVPAYLSALAATLASGQATEHSYRPALKTLFEGLSGGLTVINEPQRSQHGAPDFVFMDKNVPVLYAEAKDVGVSLEKVEKGEQMARYFGYGKVILTDGLEFRFYQNGKRTDDPFVLATQRAGAVTQKPESFGPFETAFKDFLGKPVDIVRSAQHLAQIMGGKARRIRDNVRDLMAKEAEKMAANPAAAKSDVRSMYETFKAHVLHDLQENDFADLYAQTLTYGLFVARYNDKTPDDFTRQEARELVPKSNPLLRRFFDHLAGEAFEKRLALIVDELCVAFQHANVHGLMHGLYQKKDIETHDPVVHFYEDFLREYDAKQRMDRGVFYTPAPVVRFIVRAADAVLKERFGLAGGLADASKFERKVLGQGLTKKGYDKHIVQSEHRVQVLDPATGTGTFLNEVVRHVRTGMEGQAGRWPAYVRDDLMPRLHGFELMMASYVIAHLKLGLTLEETGAGDLGDRRLQVYLTNSLEEAPKSDANPNSLFGLMQSITDEAKRAADVKNEAPVMVVLGNPPYSGISTNTGDWITEKIEDYKYVDGVHFGEKKHWLQDDYVKFFRLAESLVEKRGEGVVGYVTNHGYLDNPTFRGMRWHLLTTFDEIIVLDLHGNSLKKEIAPDGSKDENVFDIQQGVAIFIGIKTGKKKPGILAKVRQLDLYGKRDSKYEWLDTANPLALPWRELAPQAPHYFFVPRDYSLQAEYDLGVSVAELFPENVTGIVTARDSLVTDFTKENLLEKIRTFSNPEKPDAEIRSIFFPGKKVGEYPAGDSRGWKLDVARKLIHNLNHEDYVQPFSYRPFDTRSLYYHPKMVDWGREKAMSHVVGKENLVLVYSRQAATNKWSHVQVINNLLDNRFHYSNKGISLSSPLYLYAGPVRTPNLAPASTEKLAAVTGLRFVADHALPEAQQPGTFSPLTVLDWAYAQLHSPAYRAKYREFLKSDFPRLPWPASAEAFLRLAKLGARLRSLHLLEASDVARPVTTYPAAGTDLVEKIRWDDGKVWINSAQYFGQVPQAAWEFWVGGYQPAQKWLKDRVGRTLSNGDITHWQKIVVALTETAKVMGEIDQ